MYTNEFEILGNKTNKENKLGRNSSSGEVRLLNLDDVDGTGIGNNSIQIK